jgi:TolB protein
VYIPDGVYARLQTSWYVVNPKDNSVCPPGVPNCTSQQYQNLGQVINGQVFSVMVWWPGIRPGDTVVESHVGAKLLDAQGNELPCQTEDSVALYAYPERCLAAVGNFVWYDQNRDGIQEVGDVGVQGVTVTLYTSASVFVGQTHTDATGYYSFVNLFPGQYYIHFDLPPQWAFSPAKVGSDNAIDSNADPVTGNTDVFNLQVGDNDLTWDVGIYCCDNTRNATGFKFWDMNYNAVWDDFEPALPGWTIIVRDAQGQVVFTTETSDAPGTNDHGRWTLTADLVPGAEYTAEEVLQSGWGRTYPENNGGKYRFRYNSDRTITLLSAPPQWYNGDLNFGNVRPFGYKFADEDVSSSRDSSEPLISGWGITLRNSVFQIVYRTQTLSSGPYVGHWFVTTPLDPGVYYVSEEPNPEWIPTYPVPEDYTGAYAIQWYGDGRYDLLSPTNLDWYQGLNFGNTQIQLGCVGCPEWLLFQSDRFEDNANIFRSDFDGNNVVRLTSSAASDVQPTWSYDGSRIAFASNRDNDWEIYRMAPDGSGQTNVTRYPLASDLAPSWACYWIAFQSDRDGNWEIYKTDPNGVRQIRLTNNVASDEAPAWSPDERQIAFQSDRDGNWELYLMDGNGRNVRRLTNNPAADRNPSWSPDGQWIVFESNRDGVFDLYKLNVQSGVVIRLTQNAGNNTAPAWKPYCNYVFFQSNRDGDYEVYRMNDDGTGQMNLTREVRWFDVLDYADPSSSLALEMVLVDGQANYSGTADTSINFWAPQAQVGAEQRLAVRAPGIKSGLIKFDLSPLPAGAMVQQAKLTLYSLARSNTNGTEIAAYGLTKAWDEGQATWENAAAGSAWTTPGATSDKGSVVATVAVSAINRDYTWDITELAAGWASNPNSNNGVVLIATGAGSVEYTFASSEYMTMAMRPRLTITYQPN